VPPEPDFAGDKGRPFLVFDAKGHTALPRAALFTHDGKQAVTVAEDKTVRVWDVASGRPVRVLRLPADTGTEGVPLAAALTPSGKRLAVGGEPYGWRDSEENAGRIQVIDLDSGNVVQTFTGHKRVVEGLAFSRDGNYLASASRDATALVYSLQTGKVIARLPHPDGVKAVAWAPDSIRLATACHDGVVRVWNFQTRIAVELKGHGGLVNCVAFNNNKGAGMLLASGGVDGTIRLWAPTGGNRGIWKQTEDDGQTPVPITSLTFSKDGKELLYTAGGKAGQAGLLSTSNGRKRIEFKKHTNEVMAGALSPNGDLALTSGGNDHESFLWRTKDGSVLHTLKSVGRSVWAVGWSPDGKSIAWGNTNKGDTTDATTPLENNFNLEGLAFGPAPKPNFLRARLTLGDMTLAALDAYEVAVRIKDQTKYKLKSPYEEDRVYCFTLLPGKRAVLGTAEGLFLFDLAKKSDNPADPASHPGIIRTFRGHTGAVLSVAVSPDNRYFVTGSNDQTICVWHPGRSEPLLSLFAAGREWVAWTPEGYYAASAAGENMMGWLTNHGPDKLATFNPAASFRQSLHNPGALQALWRAKGDIRTALAVVQSGTTTLSVGKVLPPEVAIRTPTAEAKIEGGTVAVTAAATSKGDFPVTSMRLLVDGRPYRGTQSVKRIAAPKLGTVTENWTVKLTPGKHVFTVEAESKVSKARSPSVEVTRLGDPEVPDLYVLACGVSRYEAINPLNFGASDADLIARTFKPLENNGFIGKVHVRLYKDGLATKKGIEEGLTWLAEKMTPKDIGLFTFSGHGGRDTAGEFFLCPVDMALPTARTGVSGRFISEKLGDMPGRLICMLDACHAGAAANVKPVVTDDLVRKLTGTDCGVVCMCASAGSEYSLEGPETQAGFFTRAVADGLAGAADWDGDGIIYLDELERYIKERVQDLSGDAQHPTTGLPPELHSFPLVRVTK